MWVTRSVSLSLSLCVCVCVRLKNIPPPSVPSCTAPSMPSHALPLPQNTSLLLVIVRAVLCTIASKINVTPQRCQIVTKTAKFDRSNKFDFCYYGQVNLQRLKSSVASKWASKSLLGVTFILLLITRVSP